MHSQIRELRLIAVPTLPSPAFPASSSLSLTHPVSILTQASPTLGCQCPPKAPGGRCPSHLLGLQTKELHLPHTRVG